MSLALLALTLPALAAPPTQTVELPSLGRYGNFVPLLAPSVAYVEVCFVGGSELEDIHPAGGTTMGGNCVPGNPGFVIETAPRPQLNFVAALGVCLAQGMRLPELFEVHYAYTYATSLGFASTAAVVSWAGNRPIVDNGNSTLDDYSYKVPRFDGAANPRLSHISVYGPVTPVMHAYLCAL